MNCITQAKHQEEISGYELNVKGRSPGDQNYGWDVNARIDEQETNTSFEFLLWSDVVQDSQSRTILSTLFLLVRTAWIYLSTGALGRIGRTRRSLSGFRVNATVQFGIDFRVFNLRDCKTRDGLAHCLGIWSFHLLDDFANISQTRHQFFAYYLMHDYGFSASKMGENPPELELKITMFATSVMAALDEDWDEILIFGHSLGAHIAINVLSEVLRAVPRSWLDRGLQLSLLPWAMWFQWFHFCPRQIACVLI